MPKRLRSKTTPGMLICKCLPPDLYYQATESVPKGTPLRWILVAKNVTLPYSIAASQSRRQQDPRSTSRGEFKCRMLYCLRGWVTVSTPQLEIRLPSIPCTSVEHMLPEQHVWHLYTAPCLAPTRECSQAVCAKQRLAREERSENKDYTSLGRRAPRKLAVRSQ